MTAYPGPQGNANPWPPQNPGYSQPPPPAWEGSQPWPVFWFRVFCAVTSFLGLCLLGYTYYTMKEFQGFADRHLNESLEQAAPENFDATPATSDNETDAEKSEGTEEGEDAEKEAETEEDEEAAPGDKPDMLDPDDWDFDPEVPLTSEQQQEMFDNMMMDLISNLAQNSPGMGMRELVRSTMMWFTFLLGCAFLIFILYGLGVLIPARTWAWYYGLVLLVGGIFPLCCCLPAAIPLLIFWFDPVVARYFGRY